MIKKIFSVFIAIILIFSITSCGNSVKIRKTEASQIKYEKYDNGLISLEIPKGWEVAIAPADYIHYSFKMYDPKNPDYMLLFGLKMEGFLKTERARKAYASYYPDVLFSKLSAIEPQTTESFYRVWNNNAYLINTEDLKTDYLPYFYEFTVIEDIGDSMLGGDILRASFANGEGEAIQGLFTAAVTDVGSYYISENIWNIYSAQGDVWPLNVYHIVAMTAPDDEFNNWQGILDHCLSTLEFSSTFINGFNAEENQLVSTIQANQRIYDSISDMIMDSWEQRNASYDIISQKQSDATLGYERVYDTETGEVYRAYNGFTDDYSGNRYQTITDDMYSNPISGYIYK